MLTCILLTSAILNVLSASHQDWAYYESFKRRSNDRLGPSYARFLRIFDTNRATAVTFANTPCSLTESTSGSMQFAGGTFSTGGPGSSVSIATDYELEGPGIESL